MFTDDKTTVFELKNRIMAFNREREWEKFHNPKDVAISICLEAAELLEIFQWKTLDLESIRKDSKIIQTVSKELADIMIYVLNIANALEIDLSESVFNKIEENERKYPVEKFRGRAHLEGSK